MPTHYDMVIIGAGPSGEGAAMRASRSGLKVAVVDDKGMVGGNCTHWGTIPSKALRHAVKQVIHFNLDGMFRDIGEPRLFEFPKVLQRAERIIYKQVQLRTTFYAKNRVKLYFGIARFVDSHTIEVRTGEGVSETLKAKHFMICTGARPYHPEDIDFDHPCVFDSDSILKLSDSPRKMLIYGAGVIGCEYASIFCGLGVRVELIDTRDRLLDFLDHEISDALSYHLRDVGVLLRHSEEYESVELFDDHVIMHLKSGKRIKADALLWCNGRQGNTDQLELPASPRRAGSVRRAMPGRRRRATPRRWQTRSRIAGWPAPPSCRFASRTRAG